MKLIDRPFYMSKLSKVAGTSDIKVITGISSGWSRMLRARARGRMGRGSSLKDQVSSNKCQVARGERMGTH